jgi:hypothetical protein
LVAQKKGPPTGPGGSCDAPGPLFCARDDQSQAAAAAVGALPWFEKEARKRQKDQGPRGNEGGRGKKKTLREQIPEGFSGKASDEVGKLFNVSGKYVSEAKRLKAEAPEVYKQVRDGGKTISQAVQPTAAASGPPEQSAELPGPRPSP